MTPKQLCAHLARGSLLSLTAFSFDVMASAASRSAASTSTSPTFADGSIEYGPSGHGPCVSVTTETPATWACADATCSWDALFDLFACVEEPRPLPVPPKHLQCEENGDSWECQGGLVCEEEAGEGEVWVCHERDAVTGAMVKVEHALVQEQDASVDLAEQIATVRSSDCAAISVDEYNEPLHILSVFVLFFASLLGVGFPILLGGQRKNKYVANMFFAARHFGTGAIVSTAYVHLLYESFAAFANPCVGVLAFDPVASSVAMAGMYLVFIADFCIMRILRKRADRRMADRVECGSRDIITSEPKVELGHSHGAPLTMDFATEQARFDVYLLEGSICFHSCTVGVALGAGTGAGWVALFIALCAHQALEGVGLGARIAMLDFPKGQGWKRWIMASCFAFTTSFGIAIGIAVNKSFAPNSPAALISIGVLDALSAGVLLYGAMVELLYNDYMKGELTTTKWPRTLLAFVFLFAGSASMAAVGKWA